MSPIPPISPSDAISAFSFLVKHRGVIAQLFEFLRDQGRESPLNWYESQAEFYGKQPQLLLALPGTKPVLLEQGQLLDCLTDPGITDPDWEKTINLAQSDESFRIGPHVPAAVEIYRTKNQQLLQHLLNHNDTIFHNGKCTGLEEWNPETRLLRFRHCGYFDYLSTNLALDMEIGSGHSLRQSHVDDGKLIPLHESKLSNVLGINGLVFTTDGQMIYQQRNNAVVVRPGELCSGYSGTVDQKDIEDALVKGGRLANLDIERELEEETGIGREFIARRVFLGITRELTRGGTPEIFYALDINLSAKEVFKSIQTYGRRDDEGNVLTIACSEFGKSLVEPKYAFDLPAFATRLLTQLEQIGPVSIPLRTNIALWLGANCPGAGVLRRYVPHGEA